MCAWCRIDVVLRRGSAPVGLGSALELWFGSRWTVAVAWARGVDDGHGRPVCVPHRRCTSDARWVAGRAMGDRTGTGIRALSAGPVYMHVWAVDGSRGARPSAADVAPLYARIKRNVVLEGHRIGCRCDLSCCLSCELQSVATMYTPNGQQNIFFQDSIALHSRCRLRSVR